MKKSPLELSLILLSHNRLEPIKRAVKSIFDFVETPAELIIIDDNSLPEIKNYLKSIKPAKAVKRVIRHFFHDGINSISRSRNTGINLSNGKFIYFIADDYELTPDSTRILLQSMALSTRIGIVGPLYISKEKDLRFCGSALNIESFPERKISFEDLINMFEVDHITGMIKREVFDKAGLYDERFALRQEDMDFSLRVKQEGFKIFCQPRAAVYHHRDIGSNVVAHDMQSALALYRLKHNITKFKFFKIATTPALSNDFQGLPYTYE